MRFRVVNVETGESFFSDSDGNSYVGLLQQDIARNFGIPLQKQIPVCNNRLLKLDYLPLSAYGVSNSSEIKVYRKKPPLEIMITFLFEEYHYTVFMNTAATGYAVKERFHRHGGGLPPRRQNLLYMGAQINNHDVLVDYAVGSEMQIRVEEIPPEPGRVFTLTVSVPLHDVHCSCEVENRDTLFTVYGKVSRELLGALPHPGRWVFKFYGLNIARGVAFEDLGIDQDGDHLTLEWI